MYCDFIPIARQRLGKHIPAKRTRATEGRSLLGNGPENISPQQQRLFSVWSVPRVYERTKSEDATKEIRVESSFETPACQDMSLGAEELN
jgi:hypothetical protein